MKRVLIITLVCWLVASLFSACTPPVAPAEVKPSAIKAAGPASKASWEQNWANVLAEAKKEGAVLAYTLWTPETRVALTRAFKEKYGLNLEFSPFGTGSELLAKLQAERRAGLYASDVYGTGTATFLAEDRPESFLGPLQPLLILPEVLDTRVWQGGKLPFADKQGLVLNMIGAVNRTVVYNVNLVREGELTSYKDLLKPQYKGKITMNDPSIGGVGNTIMSHLGHNLWGEAETVDFLRKLIKEQEIVIQRDTRMHMETVVRGKYAIGVASSLRAVADFLSLGAPIKVAMVKEDNYSGASAGALSVPNKLAHPNSAVIFINWLLSREGQSILVKAYGNASTRVDVPTEGIDPLFVPVAGQQYFTDTADFLMAKSKWREIAKKTMDEAKN